MLSPLMGFSVKLLLLTKLPRLAEKLFEISVDERFVEYPFAYAHLGEEPQTILDVGCYESVFPIVLASLGHKVYGVDVQNYPLAHPNFTFVLGDICNNAFPDESFDAVTIISTLEHIGLGRYPESTDGEKDKKAVQEIIRILKLGGKVIIAVPFGKKTICSHRGMPLHRVYDSSSLQEVLAGLRIVKLEYAIRAKGEYWLAASQEEAENVEQQGREVTCIALILAQKG